MKYNLKVVRGLEPGTLPLLYINGQSVGIVEALEVLFEMVEELSPSIPDSPLKPSKSQKAEN